MPTKPTARSNITLSVEVEIRGDTKQRRPLSNRLTKLVARHHGAGLAKEAKKPALPAWPAKVPVAALLHALHPADEELFAEFRGGNPSRQVRDTLSRHWGGWPIAEFPEALVWNLGERNISLELFVFGELRETMAAVSASYPDQLISCRYTFVDPRTGDKDFGVRIRTPGARYRQGQLESTQEWRR